MAHEENTSGEMNEPKKRGRGRPKKTSEAREREQRASVAESVYGEMMARMVQALEQQNAIAAATLKNAPKRKKTLKEFIRENPHQHQQWIRPVYQNNRLADANMVKPETIALADTLAPGKYLHGIVQVRRFGDAPNNVITLVYSNKTIEQRMAIYMVAPSLNAMIASIAKEMQENGIPPVVEEAPPSPVVDDGDETDQAIITRETAFDPAMQKAALYEAMRAR